MDPTSSSRVALVAPAPRRPITLMRKQKRSRHSHHLSHLHSLPSLGSLGQDAGVDAIISSGSPSRAYRNHPYLAAGSPALPPGTGAGKQHLLSVLGQPARSSISNGTGSSEGGTASPALSNCSSSTPTVASSGGTHMTSHPNTPAHLSTTSFYAQAGRRRSSLLSAEEVQQGCAQTLVEPAQSLVGLGIAAEQKSVAQKRESQELLSPDWRPAAALYDYDDGHLPSPLSNLSEDVETGAPTAATQLQALHYPLSPIARSKHLRNPLERRLHQSTTSRHFGQVDDDELMSSESDEDRSAGGMMISQRTRGIRSVSPSLAGLPESKLLQKFLRSGAAASLLAYFDEQSILQQQQQHREGDSQHCRSASLPSPQESSAARHCDEERDIVDMDYSFDTV